MARSERAAGLIPFIIMLVLFLAALGWGYLNYSAINNTDTGYLVRLADLEKSNLKFKEEAGLRKTIMQEAAAKSGFAVNKIVSGEAVLDEKASEENRVVVKYQVDQTIDNEKMAAELKTRLTSWVTAYKVTYENARFTVEGNEIKSDPAGTQDIEYFGLPEGLAKEYTWRQMPDKFESAMNLMKSHLLALARELNVALEHVKEARQTNDDLTEQKDRVNAELRQERDNLRSRYENELSQLREQVNRLDNRVREAEAEKQQVEEDFAKREQDYKNQLLAAASNIRRLKEQIAIDRAPTADGEVLAASSSTGIAVINRGKADNLKPGTVFEVYNFAKGGVKRMKGLIKVLDVEDSQAKCAVIRMAAGDPIVAGDLIANELYNPGKTLHFFILGKLEKYGVSQAKALLEKLGNKVDSEITVTTDYLLLGKKENETDTDLEETAEYKKAKELGVKVITERDLEAFTKY